MAKTPLVASVKVADMPEVVATLRREMAKLLRAEGKRQDDNIIGWAVTRSLNAVADAFEAGLPATDTLDPRPARDGDAGR